MKIKENQTKNQSDVKMVAEFKAEVSATKIFDEQLLYEEPLGASEFPLADQN